MSPPTAVANGSVGGIVYDHVTNFTRKSRAVEHARGVTEIKQLAPDSAADGNYKETTP